MDAREERGLQIAQTNKIVKTPVGWKVPSQSGVGSYVVTLGEHPFCTCPDFEARNQPCKHIRAVEYMIERKAKPDGTDTVAGSVKMTCTQEWPAYDNAQMHEEERFVQLLRDLCNGIHQPEYHFGRPRLPLADAVFGMTYKVYSTMSGRRFMTSMREAETKQLVAKAPSFASNARYLENPELTSLLKSLIEQSARPLKAIESNFAVDSSGFSTSTYARWFDHKWGKERVEARWVKAHVMCGVKTHIVTAVECTPGQSADTVQFVPMLMKTSDTFHIDEVSADKAYSSKKNLEAANSVGAVPYIPFKEWGNPELAIRDHSDGSLWNRMWHFYNFNRDCFLEHYHKRSNVETVFSMIKAKFGSSVRTKTPTAQVNEVLCKVLCHNICCLIQSISELGLEPTFWNSEVNSPITANAIGPAYGAVAA
jgi:transposase